MLFKKLIWVECLLMQYQYHIIVQTSYHLITSISFRGIVFYTQLHLLFWWCALSINKQATSICKNQYLTQNSHFILDIIESLLIPDRAPSYLSLSIFISMYLYYIYSSKSILWGRFYHLLFTGNWGSEKSHRLPIVT